MEAYQNLNGDSGVVEFEINEDSICVRFRHDLRGYVYDASSPGRFHVEEMKILAIAGCGLGTYINKFVRKKYAHRE